MLSDKEIIDLILSPPSKEQGTKLLYEKHRELFINHFRQIVKPKEDTKDLYQDCVLDLVYKIIVKQKFDAEKGSLKNLLFIIGRNRLINQRRKRKIDMVFVDEWNKLGYIQDKSDHSNPASPMLARIKDAVQQLNEKEQRIIDLFYVKRYSMEDIRVEMDFPSVDATKMAKHRAFKNLQRLIHNNKSF